MDEIRKAAYSIGMADLLHEYWENDDGGEFSRVQERSDRVRLTVTPGARCIFSFRASSWHRAMQMYHERLGYGDYQPAEGVRDHIYTDDEAAEQNAYLSGRER